MTLLGTLVSTKTGSTCVTILAYKFCYNHSSHDAVLSKV